MAVASAFPTGDNLYKPGGAAPATGIYNVIHHPGHRASHSVMLRVGDTFPKCPKCEHTVFLLVTVAPYVFDDEGFKP